MGSQTCPATFTEVCTASGTGTPVAIAWTTTRPRPSSARSGTRRPSGVAGIASDRGGSVVMTF